MVSWNFHVGGAEMADGEGIAAEVDGVETVVHDQLGAHRVVHPRPEDVGRGGEETAQAFARILVARRGDLESFGEQGRGDKVHGRDSLTWAFSS